MDNRLLFWNPCLGETRWIKVKTGYMIGSMFALGYKDNKTCRSYKTLWSWNCRDYIEDPVVEFEIYEFCSNSWRVLKVDDRKFVIQTQGYL